LTKSLIFRAAKLANSKLPEELLQINDNKQKSLLNLPHPKNKNDYDYPAGLADLGFCVKGKKTTFVKI